MRTLVLSNGSLREVEIDNTLEALQRIVCGYIEIPYLGETFQKNNIDVVINEEGKFIEGMNKEIVIADKEDKRILDVIYGNCIFASHNEEGETIGLNDKQIRIIKKELDTVIDLIDTITYEEFTARVMFI